MKIIGNNEVVIIRKVINKAEGFNISVVAGNNQLRRDRFITQGNNMCVWMVGLIHSFFNDEVVYQIIETHS